VGSAATAAAILQKFPNLDAMMGIDSHSGLGIGNAIKEAGKVGKVLATGFDRDNSLLELIDEGVVTATVVQRTALMPYYATLILWQLHNSKVALTEDDKTAKVLNIPGFVDTGVMIVEKEQAKAFMRTKK
jgi:ABC-type sugar transport system substrate-binding protein